MKNYEVFDFDTLVNRRNTASEKWEKYQDKDVIPMWVADMDFKSPPEIIRAIQHRAAHGVFGYTLPPKQLNALVITMLEENYQWQVEPDWLVWLPGLVAGLNVASRAVGQVGDDVMTAVPIYPPFLSAPVFSHRNLIKLPLKETKNRWQFDFQLFEEMITKKSRLFMLCNPHNPVGRVYAREELIELAKICDRHNIIICSDEIHCGLIMDRDKVHIPTATLDPDIASRTITLMSPSKTFNLPGLGCAFAVISNGELRDQFKNTMAGIVPGVNALGYAAALAAYSKCADWHRELLNYLRGNLRTIERTLPSMPAVSISPVEATYLAWIDMRSTIIENPTQFFEAAGVGLQDGIEFDGPGFVRLNFGCSRRLLEKALERMKVAMNDHLFISESSSGIVKNNAKLSF